MAKGWEMFCRVSFQEDGEREDERGKMTQCLCNLIDRNLFFSEPVLFFRIPASMCFVEPLHRGHVSTSGIILLSAISKSDLTRCSGLFKTHMSRKG